MTALRPISHRAAVAALLALVVVLFLPVLAVYARAIFATESASHSPLYDFERHWPLLIRSLTVAAGAAVMALTMGVVVGYAAHRSRPFARTIIACAAAASLLTPPYVFAIVWIDLWGPAGWLFTWAPQDAPAPGMIVYGVPGAAMALAAAYYPIVAITAYTGFRRLDRRSREAVLVANRSTGYFMNIALPVIARPIVGGALAVFLLALYDFPVHSLLQVDTYLIEIHAAAEYHDYRSATLLSIPLVILAALSLVAASAVVRGRRYHSDAGIATDDQSPVRLRSLAAIGVGWIIVVVASLLPLITVATRAMPLNNFARLFETASQELVMSVLLALVASLLITTAGVVSAVVLTHRRARAMADLLSAVPFLITGPLFGLGSIAVYNRPGLPGLVYDSAGILLIAWTARYAFIAQWGLGAGVRGQSRSVQEAARVSGASWIRTQTGVTIPLARPYIAIVAGASFLLTFREIDTAVLVAPPGLMLASVRLFTLMHYGPDSYVMAMALTMSAVAFSVGAFFYAAAARWKRITDVRA